MTIDDEESDNEEPIICAACGDITYEDEVIYDNDGDPLCADCFPVNCFICCRCYGIDDIDWLDTEATDTYCRECADMVRKDVVESEGVS